MCRLFIHQFFSLFAQFKTTTKFHENYVFLYPFSNMAISPQIFFTFCFIPVNCMGWQVCIYKQLHWHTSFFLPSLEINKLKKACNQARHFVPEGKTWWNEQTYLTVWTGKREELLTRKMRDWSPVPSFICCFAFLLCYWLAGRKRPGCLLTRCAVLSVG